MTDNRQYGPPDVHGFTKEDPIIVTDRHGDDWTGFFCWASPAEVCWKRKIDSGSYLSLYWSQITGVRRP